MIPSTNTKLLVAEDWKKIYQSYRNADFKSYDFDTLRRTMITYLRENYPEDFNDFIDSSEYVALIDLIAYLGQNLSFRIDLNARENFLETAERRDSVLRLAQLISYNAKRNIPASGLLKITSIQTTDIVYDTNGTNLANTTVTWNDSTNLNWYEQFISIMNAGMPSTLSFGKPASKSIVAGVSTEKYKINSDNEGAPLYSFVKTINGSSMTFEIVSSDFDTAIKEETPTPGSLFSLLYRNDNKGNGSSNTGFFILFKQGTLSVQTFNIDQPVPNEIIGINTTNINDTDVWLWQLNSDGTYPDLPWTKVSTTTGNNIIYNSIVQDNRNLYSVITKEDDTIDLAFTDGSFGNLPKGQFKLFYRQSNGLSYLIKQEQMKNINFIVSYKNSLGQSHSLTVTAALQYNVSNSALSETNDEIKRNAPQVYYSQNRMVTAEDYNILPLTAGSDILKVKSINRISSGISKYFELSDVSGRYSDVNIFGNDGIIYKEQSEYNFEYSITTKNDIKFNIKTNLTKIFNLKEFRSFYIDNYTRPSFVDYNVEWVQSTKTLNQVTGYFILSGSPVPVADFSSNNLKYAKVGALIKFVPPTKYNPALGPEASPVQQYFLPNGKLTFIESAYTTRAKWVKVISIVGDGYNEGKGALSTGIGPVTITGNIPTGAVPEEIITKFINIPGASIETEIVNLSLTKKNFGLSLDQDTNSWFIISDLNIDLSSPFSLVNQKNSSESNRDSSWMVAFVWTGNKYKVRYRVVEYIFESANETSFFVDPSSRNYDYTTDSVIKDKIAVLNINASPTDIYGASLKTDQNWQIDNPVIAADGFQEPKKVKVSFYDKDDDGLIDNPDSFIDIVDPDYISQDTNFKINFIFFKQSSNGLYYSLVDSSNFYCCPTENDVSEELKIDGNFFYFYDNNVDVIKTWQSSTLSFVLQPSYIARPGRAGLKFQYSHRPSDARRIDPSKTNLIDTYILTKSYDSEFRKWLMTNSGTEPLPPTSQSLEISYSSSLTPIKSISDEIVYHSANYKILFGSRAPSILQATFKAVRNASRSNSDNDLKTRILSAIESFFSVDNWEFGQTFYFSELTTYVMNIMTPDITNFIIVPKQENSFGSLYEIKCQSNEIFVSGTTTSDIEIINSITATELKSSGNIVNTVGGQV